MNRRDALKALPILAAMPAFADSPGTTVRMSEPPFSEQKTFITPTEQFYVRNHFATPTIDEQTFVLEVSGAVRTPLKLRLAELKALPTVTKPLTLECAGNGRVFLAPPVRGLQWQCGAVGTAEWTGVNLSTLLDNAGGKPGAVKAILIGADKGVVSANPPSPGPIHFDRSIPICWRLWESEWSVPKSPGPVKLLARCIDAQGHGQPEKRDPDRRTCAVNHLIPVEVEIVARRSP